MSCPSCSDRGVFTVKYRDGSPDEYAICFCSAGQDFRLSDNNGKAHIPHYHVWAIRSGIDPARVAPMEVLLTDEELAARGFSQPATDALSREAALMAAGKKAKR